MEQPERNVFVEFLDRLTPVFPVKAGAHQLPLLPVKLRIAAKHEVPSFLSHEQRSGFPPRHVELVSMFQDILGPDVRGQVDSRRD